MLIYALIDCGLNPEVDADMILNVTAVIQLLDLSKSIGANIYPFIAGAGFLIGISKVL